MALTIPTSARSLEALTVEDLRVELKGGRTLTVLRGVSIAVTQGRVLGLIGESGSGKTMTCRAIAGALPRAATVSGGEIRLGSDALTGRRRLDQGIAMIFADPHAALDPLQRVGAQIAEVARVQRGVGRREAREEALRLLAQVAISDPERTARAFPFELSGGMAQRAMIASVLAGRPRFVLADEPTSALDATVQLEILDLLRSLVREDDVGLVLTTHDMAAAARICDDICVMYAGRVIEHGPAEAVLRDPQHPYTRLLVQARPRGHRAQRLTAIGGEPPSPDQVIAGCSFAPRCPYAADVCREADPALTATTPRTEAACHFAGRLDEART